VSKIAIVGGHGKVAMILSKLLVEQGHQVTSFFRNPEHHGDVETTGASPVVLDVERSSTEVIAEQIAGHDALIWSAGAGGGNPPRTYAVDRDAAIRSMDAAAQAGVRRYVMISYLGSDLNHGVPEGDPFFPYAEAKAAADAYLRETDLDWTILGPGRLTMEPASGKIQVNPPPGTADHDTSRANVAAVAVAVLAEPRTIGRTIPFVDGDEPIERAILSA